MNLAKVALYLEYIAFCVRRQFAPHTIGVMPMARNEVPTDQLPPNPPPAPEQPAAPGEATEEEGATRRATDPELRVMGRVLREIEDLKEPARGRVVRWLSSRYEAKEI